MPQTCPPKGRGSRGTDAPGESVSGESFPLEALPPALGNSQTLEGRSPSRRGTGDLAMSPGRVCRGGDASEMQSSHLEKGREHQQDFDFQV